MRYAGVLSVLWLAGCSTPGPPLEVLGTVPDFTLTAQTGGPFDSKAVLRGQVWVADFIFTNCQGPCPRMTSQLRKVQEAIPGVRLVSFTVDPERDTPEVLAAYAKRFQAGPNWFFLTGTREELHHMAREVFLLGNVDGQLNHSTRFVLVDRESRIRAYYDTSEPDSVGRLIGDIRRLERDAP